MSAEHLAIGDFDGDGQPDIAITDGYQKTVSVYLNQGRGAFAAAPVVTTLTIDNTAGALVAGDFNGDGKADLIVATIAGDQVSLVLLATGSGHFAVQPPLPGSFGFSSGKLADFNHDGQIDAVFCLGGTAYLYFGKGDGTFTQSIVPNRPFQGGYVSVTAGVFSGSGSVDAAVANFSDPGHMLGTVDFFAGHADGSLGMPTFFMTPAILNPGTLDAADFNQDGKLDLLIAGSGGAVIAPGNGDGTFQFAANQTITLNTTEAFPGLINPEFSSAVAVDLNLDKRPDAVVLNNNTGALTLLPSDGQGKFPSALETTLTFQFPALSYNLAAADLNGDGLPDIVASTPSAKTVTVLLSSSSPAVPVVALTASGSNLLVGSGLSVTANISGGSGVPTGTATLLDGSTVLGQQTLDANGAAQFALSTLGVGSHALTVNYSGDARYSAASSAALAQQVTDFTPTLASPTQMVAAGASASFPVSIQPQSGFTGSVTLTCSGLPSYATCSAASVNVAGSAATATVTVATTPSALAWADLGHGLFYAWALGGLPLLRPRRYVRGRSRLYTLLIVLPCSLGPLGMLGCGGSGKTVQAPTQAASQTSSFTITATATQNGVSVSHAVTAVLVTHS